MRRRALTLGALTAVVVAAIVALDLTGGRGSSSTQRPDPAATPARPLAVTAGPADAQLDPATRQRIADDPVAAANWLAARRSFVGQGIRGGLAWDTTDAVALATAAGDARTEIALAPRVTDIALTLPVVRQAYRNNCETAALSMALRGRVDQRRLQSLLPVSEPVDPRDGSPGRVWGDPQAGFVGRAGGGGFGVFERPIAALGRRFDRGTEIIRANRFDQVLDEVRAGRPVLAWIALGRSVPATWTTPDGRAVAADFSEHVVVLAAVTAAGVRVHDPWTGTTRLASPDELADGWRRIGRRAVATSPTAARLATR